MSNNPSPLIAAAISANISSSSKRLLPAYPLPAERRDETVMRAVVRHGFSRDMADLLLADIERGLRQLDRHPPSSSLTWAEAGGFDRNATAWVHR
ncbi:hypothetical protein ABZ942_19700 [Nocardia sp. NPDC046473]|uniref:hypothetical protein n=1 Tax=Nocardia sp. NPDC046473 TaxID=3155733 RepID=UPI0033C7DDC0